jgi:UDP-glucose 4-epimerase
MAKVLVTGGSGFLGSHIADALTAAGHDVTIFDIHPSAYIQKEKQKMIIGSILDRDCLEKMFADGQFDYVYHLAALADLNEALSKPRLSAEVNILGTINILEACVKHKIARFLFGSSVYVYSKHGGFYRCSKQACENYVEEFFNTYGLNFTILRYGSLYGPRSDSRNGVFRLLQQAIKGQVIVYHGSTTDKREYIHVLDAARLSVQALNSAYEGKHLIITGNDKLSVHELFTMFREMLNREVQVKYEELDGIQSGHYSITPYTFTPKLGIKLTTTEYVDMGQGLLELIQEIHNQQDK